MGYFAQFDGDSVVRGVVASTLEWCVDNLGGDWAEMPDPYVPDALLVLYVGPGHAVPEWSAGSWGNGVRVRHAGRIWVSTKNNNTSIPGEPGSNWQGPGS